jgi:hypothetical protein
MKAIYELCGITRQAHQQAIQRSLNESEKAHLYVRLMEGVRQEHPGMGLRTMYELLQPDGIGRDAFVSLGLQEGFRLKTVEKYTRTTYSVKSSRHTICSHKQTPFTIHSSRFPFHILTSSLIGFSYFVFHISYFNPFAH